MTADVLVIGAGLTGLVTAHALQRAGRAVVVLEAASRPGGVIGTATRAGALYERGPNTAMDTSDAVAPLLAELGIAGERIDASAAAERRYIVRRGALTPLPSSPLSLAATPLLSAAAKWRLLREPWAAPAPAGVEESVADFVRRRLGSEVLQIAVEPFVSGIYAGDPEALSLAATFPRLQQLEARGGLVRGVLALARERRRQGVPRRRPKSFSFRGGMQVLTDALAARLPGLHCAVTVANVRRAVEGFEVHSVAGHTWHARRVVIATPAYAGAPLVAELAPDAAAALSAIEYAPISVAAMACARADIAHPLDGFGFLAPADEPLHVLGTLFSSTMFDGRAPANVALLTSFLGGRRHPDDLALDDVQLLARVQRDLQTCIGLRAPPLWSDVVRWPRAIPQTTRGHTGRIARLAAAERAVPGLHFAGSYRGGVSISDCIDSGRALAARLIAAQP